MLPFRKALLQGRSIAVAGTVSAAVRDLLEALGARTSDLDTDDEERASEWARLAVPVDVLVCGERDGQAVDGSLALTWTAVKAIATEAFVTKQEGRIVLLAPRESGRAVAAALENLARTPSVEWARFNITVVAIAPRPATSDEALAQLVAFLCGSPKCRDGPRQRSSWADSKTP